MRPWGQAEALLQAQRGHLFPWAPVCFGIGVALFFSLRVEPDWRSFAAAGGLGAASLAVTSRRLAAWRPLGWMVALAAAGFCNGAARAHLVSAPVLAYRYYGPIEGRVIGLDRSASDALRVTLDQVRLARVPPSRTPARIRIALHGPGAAGPWPGRRVMTTGHLLPPRGPAEPGGFDFARHAWFQRIGAVGYTRVPVVAVSRPGSGGGLAIRLLRIRQAASDRIREILPGDRGGFAAAVTTGDRSGISREALQALRQSNLAHLLAISGLHMGLLAGFVFGAVRLGVAAVPALALRVPGQKVAAVVALAAAAGYLALSGRNVATERAFVMVAVALVAVLADRRVLSLRAVATAALIVLGLRPEAVLSPGFQMSFAATTALVAVFGWLREATWEAPRWLRPAVALVLSSAVAGAATAPFAAAHFNMFARFGLLANLVSVPLMGLVVIPGTVLSLCLAPLGLEVLGLAPVGVALDWILGVAGVVSHLPGAVGHVPRPPAAVLPLLSLGALWILLWQGPARGLGALPLAVSLLLWISAERPAILIEDSGRLVGVMTPQGRALSKPRGAGFTARIWLENDGDGASQAGAAARWTGEGQVRRIAWTGGEIVHLTGKRAARSFGTCTAAQTVVSPVPIDAVGPCRRIEAGSLAKTGAVAVFADREVTARDRTGSRLWSAW